MQKKIEQLKQQSSFKSLPGDIQQQIVDFSEKFYCSFQELKQLTDISIDLYMWNERSFMEIIPEITDIASEDFKNRSLKGYFIKKVVEEWQELKNSLKCYGESPLREAIKSEVTFVESDPNSKILGLCPVASPKTRCCNLQTLDIARNCGFDCSYCCLQSFFDRDKVFIESNLKKKLSQLNLDSTKNYHIGTGQHSDSLMWGDQNGILSDLVEFAKDNNNVILELKNKSKEVDFFLDKVIPRNLFISWSLNTQTVIENEEVGAASLGKRLKAARAVADKNILVGFHFHPMVYYKGWQDEYRSLISRVQEMFMPEEIAFISFGTLTYIKPVVQKIRKRMIKSKILQMSLVDVAGKLSYPDNIKRELFALAYQSFKNWHDQIFFYFCMEPSYIWEDIFGFDYRDNDQFESAKIDALFKKIRK